MRRFVDVFAERRYSTSHFSRHCFKRNEFIEITLPRTFPEHSIHLDADLTGIQLTHFSFLLDFRVEGKIEGRIFIPLFIHREYPDNLLK